MLRARALASRKVRESLREDVGLEIDLGRGAVASHDQSHSSDATGTSHHYSTPRAYLNAEELRVALQGANESIGTMAARGRADMTTTVHWSVERGGAKQESTVTIADDDPKSIDPILSRIRDDLTGAGEQPEDTTKQSANTPNAARQPAVRASRAGVSASTAKVARDQLRSAGQDVMHDQTHSEGGGRIEAEAGLASRLTGGLEDSMHGQTHSSGGGGGGGGSLEVARTGPQAAGRLALARRQQGLGGQDVMHDQTHSEGGAQVEARATLASRLTGGLEDSMHGQTHSSGGGGGGGSLGMVRGGPQASGRLGARRAQLGSLGEDLMHDQTHSEGGHADARTSLASPQLPADAALHDQTHSEGGGHAEMVNKRVAEGLNQAVESDLNRRN